MPLPGFGVGHEYAWDDVLQQLGMPGNKRAVVVHAACLLLFLTEGHPDWVNWFDPKTRMLNMQVNPRHADLNALLAGMKRKPRLELFYRRGMLRDGAAAPFTYVGEIVFRSETPGNPLLMHFELREWMASGPLP